MDNSIEIRCKGIRPDGRVCGILLGKGIVKDGIITIKCRKCNFFNVIGKEKISEPVTTDSKKIANLLNK